MATVRIALLLVALLAGAPSLAADVHFYEAQKSCMVAAEPHSFKVQLSIVKSLDPTYSIKPESAYTQCLRAAAEDKEPDGAPRRLALGASLRRAVSECLRGSSEKPRDFEIHFVLNERGGFGARSTPTPVTRFENCVMMLMSITQPMGLKQ